MKKGFAVALAFLLCAQVAWAAIVVEDTCTGQTSIATNPHTAANCTVTGANTYIACFISGARSTPTVTSVTWDAAGANQSLAAIPNTRNTNTNRAFGEWWGLANPTAGTNKSVTTQTSSASTGTATHCQMYSGVDQSTPVSGGVTSNTDGASASVVVTSATGDLVAAGLVLNNEDAPGTINAGAGETIQSGPTLTTRAAADENINVVTLTEPGAASTTINPTWSVSTDLVLSAFSLKAAAASSTLKVQVIEFQ